MIQQVIVGLIVACAAFAVLRRYAPKALKRQARIASVRLAKSVGWHRMAERLSQQAEAGASCGDGCGSCGNCGTQAAPNAEVKISVDSIKRRVRR